MNKLDEIFKSGKKNLLNIYCTAGYPYKESTGEVMLALQKHGADMIEIGIPYGDPVADGPIIQQSNMRALQKGMTVGLLLQQLEEVKEAITVPVILMGYLNPVLQYGIEKFCAEAKSAGVHGVILPDLPFHEFEKEYKSIFKKHKLHFIFLITPETNEKRIRKMDQLSSGFLYAVSSSSTTGSTVAGENKDHYFKKLRQLKLKNPIMIGFGISDRASFENACKYASGSIIGSSYIKAISDSGDIDELTQQFISLIKDK
ncbi:MAG: tryptophan synthase subunit alpha [Ferruginibacter sp.]